MHPIFFFLLLVLPSRAFHPPHAIFHKAPLPSARRRSSARGAEPDGKKIQFLISDTGGGHRASAVSLSSAIQALSPTTTCDVVDIYATYCPPPFKYYPELYKLMVGWEGGILWKAFYEGGETMLGRWFNELVTEVLCEGPFKECLKRTVYNKEPGRKGGAEVTAEAGKRADLVVSVHPLTQVLPMKVLADLDVAARGGGGGGRSTKFLTVCTDLGSASKSWFNAYADRIVVPTPVLREKAIRMCREEVAEYDEERVSMVGLPVRPAFRPEGSKEDYKKKVGVEEGKMVLVVGGGDGMGPIVEIAASIEAGLPPNTSVVVICGSNSDAQSCISSTCGDKVKAVGYVENMPEYMNAADLLVSKAGPGTIAEAAVCGLPTLLYDFLPGQEEGNVDFVTEGGWGEFVTAEEAGGKVKKWLEEGGGRGEKAREAGRPDATEEIARIILKEAGVVV